MYVIPASLSGDYPTSLSVNLSQMSGNRGPTRPDFPDISTRGPHPNVGKVGDPVG
jgi:hypothetical protein